MNKNIEKKTLLKNVNFDFDADEDNPLGCHIHYTTGAASLMDEPLLLKSEDIELTEEEKEILKKVIKKPVTKTKDETMDEKVLKDLNAKIDTLVAANEKAEAENVELKKQLKIDGIKKDIKDFNLENEDEIVKVLEGLEDVSEVIKAFTFLKAFEVEKEENTLQKQLSQEAGADGEAVVVDEDINTKIKKARGIK